MKKNEAQGIQTDYFYMSHIRTKEDRGKDYYKETVKKVVKTLARQYKHAYMRQRADMKEAVVSKPYLVPLPYKSNVEDEYTSRIMQCDI
ncbi:hypothetical protein V2J09_006545 [Rumex salicifolius]